MVRGGEGPAAATPLIMHTVVAASVVSKETSPVVNPHRVIVARYAGARGEAEGDWFVGIGLKLTCIPSFARGAIDTFIGYYGNLLTSKHRISPYPK